MKYALLIYSARDASQPPRPLDAALQAVLDRPSVLGWTRLQHGDSATTVRHEDGRRLLTDGPFIDSKEILAGIINIEADDLDAALAIVEDLQATRTNTVFEVRPVLEAS